jgi:hypothetical protein
VTFPKLTVHGHALQPESYQATDTDGKKRRFKGWEVYVTLNTGERIMMVLPDSGREAYNQAAIAAHQEEQSLRAAEKRRTENEAVGVDKEQGSALPQER